MTPFAKIFVHLKDVTRADNRAFALCPAHDEPLPSLTIADEANGNVTLACEGGCTTQDIITALQLTLDDLPMISAPRRGHSEKPEKCYQLVESLCPGSKLDMSARRPRDGWTGWGGELAQEGAA